MLEKRVVIDRLLYSCGSEIPIDPDGLLDTNEGIFQKYNGLIGIDEFSKLPGAIILAEGGMGKSIVMQQLQSRFPDGKSHLIELGLFAGNPVGLSIEIDSCFETSGLSATSKYAMLIDGLDEAPDLAGAVLLKLRKLPANVVVWIASRDMEAIRAIQSGFPMLGAYTLAPLTINDIRELAKCSQVDAEIFVAAMLHSGITAICAKPMGCNLAITVFRENGLVAVRQVDLWQQGINRLCDETPSETRRLIMKPAFNLEEVINCCAWMALGLVVSGKVAIWNGEESHCPSNCSSLSDISSSDYPLELIKESLKRGVFSPLGDGRFRFSHITYRDYFASLGFARCIPPAHWSTLLFTSDKSGVLPQRTGVATWLSAQNHGFLEELAGVEPEILLSSVDAIHAIGPTALCMALLDRSDSISYERRHLGPIADNLFRLSNTSVSGVIRDRLTASNTSDAEIDFAIEIARACRCVDLSDVLAEKVLDENTTLHERVSAAYAICELDDNTAKGRLKQLLPLDPREDTFDQLRGSILRCCWPDHLQVDELFENLSPPQRSNYVGPYEIFLDYELPASFKMCIKENVASKYLQWSLQHITRDQILDRLGRLASFIYTYCWNWALTPDLSSLLAIGYLKALKLNTTPFAVSTGSLGIHNDLVMSRDEFMKRIDERFAVLEALLKTTEIDNSTLMHLSINAYPLFGADDASSILEKTMGDPTGPLAVKWIQCFMAVVWRIDLDRYSEKIDGIHEIRPELIDSVQKIKQDILNQARQSQDWNQQWKHEEEQYKRKGESDQLKIDLEIKSILSQAIPAPSSFVGIAIWLDSKNGVASPGAIDLTKSPGWTKLFPHEKTSLIMLAERYLQEGHIEETAPDHLIFSVVQAFSLLRTLTPEKYQALSETIWQKASVEILKLAFGENMEFIDPLFDTLATKFPETAEKALIQTIRQQVAPGRQHVSILRYWGKRLTNKQSDSILQLVEDESFDEGAKYAILIGLTECGRGGAVGTYLEKVLENEWNPHPDKSLNNKLLLALSLSPDTYIPNILGSMKADRAWGRQWFEFAVMEMFTPLGRTMTNCSSDLIASTYIWLHTEYPTSARPDRQGAYSPGPFDRVYELKDYLISHLSRSGMKGSASALEGISLVFPLDRWLHDLILNAKRNEDAAKIPTISFAEIKVLRENNFKSQRFINSIDDLRNLLLSMLTEYERLLQGDTPGVVDLWNTQIPIRPKSEEDLSNHLSRFLKLAMGSGIVINREVQIRHKLYQGGKPGSRTDLWVQAIDKAQQVLTICIEVKCNWNSTAKSALQDQLVDKYMSGGTADAGVLVLGWYSCPKWDMTDNRQSLSTATWIDANSARSDIENQSIQIRKTGYNVTASVINCSMV